MMRRERRLPALGAVVLLLLLIAGYRLLDMPAALREAPSAPMPPPAPLPAAAPPVVPAASADGLRLHGVTGAGAIIGGADGRQRLVAIGRDVVPGLALAEVHSDHALLRSVAGDIRLDFSGATAATPSAPAPAASSERDDNLRYRLGLAPHRVDGRVVGHEVRPGADLPALAAAGIRPGDVILRVNGSQLDEERVAELAWTLANSDRVAFEIERGGRSMRFQGPR
jgi:hypothetical protein